MVQKVRYNVRQNDMISNTNSSSMSKCAACGKGGDNLKVCSSCERVSYCNAKCRNAHRSKHKKECRQYTAEIRDKNAAIRADFDAISEKLSEIEISDEELFADPPPKEDCPICMLPIPYALGMHQVETTYQPCCGKTLCNGCLNESYEEMDKGNLKDWCAFCRQPNPNSLEELMERVKKRIAMGDAEAFHWLGGQYYDGNGYFSQDYNRAFTLWNKAADLGSVRTHNALALAYDSGDVVERDVKRAFHHYKIAAIGGHEYARYYLGVFEYDNGDIDRSIKHYMMAARNGFDESLREVGGAYKAGHITKDQYLATLCAYQDSQAEMRSEQRTKAYMRARKQKKGSRR